MYVDYRYGEWHVSPAEGQVYFQQQAQKIRPKTLQVLLYLLARPGQIISKQELLDAIWDDVHAQDHVLFQSINEIRSLFDGQTLIKTHPRKGYEWLVPWQPVDTSQQSSVAATSPNAARPLAQRIFWLFTAVIVATTAGWYFFTGAAEKPERTTNPPMIELVITPVQNDVRGNQHDWVRLGAMDMLINQLQQQTPFVVVSTEDVLAAIERSDTQQEQNQALLSRKLRSAMGEITTLHANLKGGPMEYELHYRIIDRHHSDGGVLFAPQVPELVNKLSQKVIEKYGLVDVPEPSGYDSVFSDQAFLKAMGHFHDDQMQAAQTYFEAALQASPQMTIAQRFLARSIARQNDLDGAYAATQKALAMAEAQEDQHEYLRSLFDLANLSARRGDIDAARSLSEQTHELAEKGSDLLYIAYSLQLLGHLQWQEQNLTEAQHYFSKALGYHQGFQCAYGQTFNLTALAMLSGEQGHMDAADGYFDQAMSMAQRHDLVFEQIEILLSRATNEARADRMEAALEQISRAKTLAEGSQNPYLVSRVDAWDATPSQKN